MCERMNCILGRLRISEHDIKRIDRVLIRQASFNGKVMVITALCACWVVSATTIQYKQAAIIEKLEEEIKKLKREEGE